MSGAWAVPHTEGMGSAHGASLSLAGSVPRLGAIEGCPGTEIDLLFGRAAAVARPLPVASDRREA